MLKRFMPREGRFFDLFEQSAQIIVQATQEFQKMLKDMPNAEKYWRKIDDLEHQADEITHRTVELLHLTFITPMDRQDIHALISKLDDVVDFTKAAAERIVLYEVKEKTPEMEKLVNICAEAGEIILKAVPALDNLKNPDDLKKLIVEIHRLENEADHTLRQGMAKLFREEQDIKKLIKLKEIYELLEQVSDVAEDVANIIEGIVLEYS